MTPATAKSAGCSLLGALPQAATAAAAPLLRVVFVIPGPPVGNSMIFARRQAEAMAGQNVAVELFHLRTRTSPWGLCKGLLAFRRLIRRFRPQVIHAHFGTVTALFAAVAAPFHPLVITFRGGDLNPVPPSAPLWDRFRSRVGCLISQVAALRATRIICVSRQLRDKLLWRQQRSCILPSGVATNVFFPQPRALARRKLGWNLEQPVALFNAGGSAWIKRPALARQAAACARRRIPDLRLHEIDGSLDPAQVPWFMNAVDCLLLTSATEGSPTVVQEALACGVPVVAVRVGDTEERLAHCPQSRLVADHPEALGQALYEVITAGRGDGRAAPLDADLETFSATRIAKELREIYLEAAQHVFVCAQV